MDKLDYNRSLKDIPIPPEDQYRKLLLAKTEDFLQRLRWKVYFYLNPDVTPPHKETYGFRTHLTAPRIKELIPFEDELAELVSSRIHFSNFRSPYQQELKKKIWDIRKSDSYLLKADKTTNIYKVSGQDYSKLLNENITKDYQKTSFSIVDQVNEEARYIAVSLELGSRIEEYSDAPAFINIKDHKEKFETEKKCRLINPAKSQIGKISKQLLQKINQEVRENTGLKQWQSTEDVLSCTEK